MQFFLKFKHLLISLLMDLNTINKEIIQSLPKKKYIIESEISGVSNRRGNTYFDFKDDSNNLA